MRKPWFCIVDEPGPRKPWFRIIDVTELNGRSIADIAAEVAERCNVPMASIRGGRLSPQVVAARKEVLRQIHLERPDLSSGTVAAFLRLESSTVRHHWRNSERGLHS